MRDLVTDGNENLRRAFEILADGARTREVRQFGPLTATCAGVSVRLLSRVFVFNTPPVGDLSRAVAWMAERDVPFWVTATDPAVTVVKNRRGDLDLNALAEADGKVSSDLDPVDQQSRRWRVAGRLNDGGHRLHAVRELGNVDLRRIDR